MKFGLPISLFMHLSFVFGGLLMWNNNVAELADVRIIPLDLVTVSEITNIKPVRKKVEPEAEPEDQVTEPEPEPEPEILEPEQPTQDIEDEVSIIEQPEEPENVEPEKQASFNLDDFAAVVDQARQENPDANTQTIFKSDVGERAIAGAGQEDGMTVSEQEYIRAKMRNCYKIDTGAKDYRSFRVEIRVHLNIDGEVQSIDVLNNMQIIASPNNAWRAARDNVIFALNDCAPYNKLPKANYENWKRSKLNFQPANIEG